MANIRKEKYCKCGCKTKLIFRSKHPNTIYVKGHQKSRLGIKHTDETKLKISLTNKRKGLMPPVNIRPMGKNHHNWKGGVTTIDEKLRKSKEAVLWRIAVFARDDYTCQECGERGGNLNADHIKPWALYPELRFAIDNGRTLCKDCHLQTDTWGGRTRWLM